MNKTFFLPLIIIFFSLYYFIFPADSNTETVWTTAYSQPLSSVESSDVPLHETVVIDQGDQKAVIRTDDKGVFLADYAYRGGLSSSRLLYNSDGVVYIEEFGSYPYAVAKTSGSALVLGDRYFTADYSTAYIEEYDISGRSLWFWRGLAPITALAWNDKYVAVGSLDGTVNLINQRGDIIEYPVVSEERDQVVYGVAVSGDSSRISIVSGLRNQVLRTYSVDETPTLLSQIKLESHFRRPVKLYYSYYADYLWVEQEDGILQLTDNEPVLHLPLEDTFLTLCYDREGQIINILSLEEDGKGSTLYSLKSLSPEGNLLFETKTEYIPYSFQLSASDLAFGMNDNLVILSRREM